MFFLAAPRGPKSKMKSMEIGSHTSLKSNALLKLIFSRSQALKAFGTKTDSLPPVGHTTSVKDIHPYVMVVTPPPAQTKKKQHFPRIGLQTEAKNQKTPRITNFPNG